MSSPYAGFENSVIIFPVQSGEVETDEFGNVVSVTRSVKVIAKLKQSSVVQQAKAGDIDDNAILIEGFCVEPMVLPASIKTKTWATVDFSGTEGFFYLTDPINPPHGRLGIGAIMEQEAGTKIVGWFQVTRSQK